MIMRGGVHVKIMSPFQAGIAGPSAAAAVGVRPRRTA